MATRSVQVNETERIHFFFPDFNEDVAIIKERKMENEWKVEPMMVLPRILLENVTAIRLTDEVSLDYKQFVVDFYQNRQTDLQLQVSDKTPLSRAVRAHFCDYQLSCHHLYENQEGFFRDAEFIRFCWCLNEDEDMDNGWVDDSLSPSLFANLNVHEEVENEGNLCDAEETPGSQFERPLPNAPKKLHGDQISNASCGLVRRCLTYDSVNDLDRLWLDLESDKNAEVVEKTEPVVIDLTGDSEEEDKVATKTTTHSTLPNSDVVAVVLLSSDSEKENRDPDYKHDDVEISEEQTLASPNRNESTPLKEILTIKPILEPHFSDSTDAEKNVSLSILNAPKKRVFKRKYRTQQLNSSYDADEDDDDEKNEKLFAKRQKLRRVLIFASDSEC